MCDQTQKNFVNEFKKQYSIPSLLAKKFFYIDLFIDKNNDSAEAAQLTIAKSQSPGSNQTCSSIT
jgi:hypothetical protein